MGIARLTQDFRPYLENAIISRSASFSEALRVERIVIDGPSIVYEVYNRLVRCKTLSLRTNELSWTPSYSELGRAAVCFLKDLESCGVKM